MKAPKEKKMQWDAFIAHASEDKINLVTPLAETLRRLGIKVWFDQFTLEAGDSLSRSIDNGLVNSKYGIIIISKHFIGKGWPIYELRGLVTREINGSKVIIPIWHGVTKKDVVDFSPSLADKLALNTSEFSIEEIALRILKIVRPDIFNNYYRLAMLKQLEKNPKNIEIELKNLIKGPIRHKSLPDALLVRIKNLHQITKEIIPISLDDTIDNFKRDLNPFGEIETWEKLIAVYLDLVYGKQMSANQKRVILEILIALSAGVPDKDLLSKHKNIDNKIILDLIKKYRNVLPEEKRGNADFVS